MLGALCSADADERAEHELVHGTAASTEARMLEAASAGDQQAILDSEELQLFRQVPAAVQS